MIDDAVTADPSSATTEPSTSGPAPPTPVTEGHADATQQPFHMHPRFRELIGENRSLKSTVGQLNARLEQLERRSDTRGGTLNPDEQAQYREAAAALKRIFAADPELAELMEARQYFPALAQGYQGVQALSAAQAQAHQQAARSHIAELAAKEGLPTDKKYLSHITRLVAGEAMQFPDGNERYDRGDFSVLDEAFEQVKESFLGLMRREMAGVTTGVKTRTKGLPPAPRGGAAGPDVPPKPVEGKERDFIRDLHRRGLSMLRERTAE